MTAKQMDSKTPSSSMVKAKGGIEWYIEQQGSGPPYILIPSGEGDCESFAKIAAILAQDFSVTTFDMPGLSRSIAPASAVENVTGPLLAEQTNLWTFRYVEY